MALANAVLMISRSGTTRGTRHGARCLVVVWAVNCYQSKWLGIWGASREISLSCFDTAITYSIYICITYTISMNFVSVFKVKVKNTPRVDEFLLYDQQ